MPAGLSLARMLGRIESKFHILDLISVGAGRVNVEDNGIRRSSELLVFIL